MAPPQSGSDRRDTGHHNGAQPGRIGIGHTVRAQCGRAGRVHAQCERGPAEGRRTQQGSQNRFDVVAQAEVADEAKNLLVKLGWREG
ncbi:hypothetical protein ACWD7F_37380 [Streptomyces sp. NPDC005122]